MSRASLATEFSVDVGTLGFEHGGLGCLHVLRGSILAVGNDVGCQPRVHIFLLHLKVAAPRDLAYHLIRGLRLLRLIVSALHGQDEDESAMTLAEAVDAAYGLLHGRV